MHDRPAPLRRRTVAAGVAWSAPLMLLGTSAPALAASYTCPADAGWQDATRGSRPTWGVVRAAGGGSLVDLNLGDLSPRGSAPPDASGFVWRAVSVVATAADGTSHVGTITTQSDTILTLTGGGALFVSARFADFAYGADGSDPDWNATHHLQTFAVTYTLTWYDGVTRLPSYAPCTYTSAVSIATHTSVWLTGRLTTFR